MWREPEVSWSNSMSWRYVRYFLVLRSWGGSHLFSGSSETSQQQHELSSSESWLWINTEELESWTVYYRLIYQLRQNFGNPVSKSLDDVTSLDPVDGKTLTEFNAPSQLDRNFLPSLSLLPLKRTYGLDTLHPSVPSSSLPLRSESANGPDGWSSYSFISDSIHPSLHPSLCLTDDTGCCFGQMGPRRLQKSENKSSSAAKQRSASGLTH